MISLLAPLLRPQFHLYQAVEVEPLSRRVQLSLTGLVEMNVRKYDDEALCQTFLMMQSRFFQVLLHCSENRLF